MAPDRGRPSTVHARKKGDRMPKNIVVFSDGTGQEGGKGHNTNVYRLFNMITDRSPEQIGFYDRGLGTGIRKITGSIVGAGMSKNIRECYQFIFENFRAGDQIYLFGFSRGAATVRSLSAFIHMFGILPKSRPELIKQAYKIYEKGYGTKRTARATKFLSQHHTMWTKVKFLGVWDTVAALGVPFRTIDVLIDRLPGGRHKFHDFALSPCVEFARHALAIDDERKTFHPLLWKEIDDKEQDKKDKQDKQVMKQVWFCGMHTDVGGGYPESGLSDTALEWMLDEAEHKGLHIHKKLNIDPKPNGEMHNSRSGFPGSIFRHEQRSWPAGRKDGPVIHKSVQERTKNQDNKDSPPYKPWIMGLSPKVEGE